MTRKGYLARLTLIVVSVIICALLTSQVSVADFKGNQWEARKVPWRAGAAYSVSWGCVYNETEGICEHGGAVPQDTYALDFNMGEGAPVHSSGTGIVVAARSPANTTCEDEEVGYGCYVDVQHSDGSVARYAHLSAVYSTSGQVFQGQFIGRAGDTGFADGAHLHFRMLNSAGQAIKPTYLPPGLSGYNDDDLVGSGRFIAHTSDNAGIGDACGSPCNESTPIDSSHYGPFTQAYNGNGGYNTVGVTFDPCGNEVCWWVHIWGSGWIQDFIGPNRGQGDGGRRALMQDGISSTAYHVSGGIWERYKALQWQSFPWIGYPTSDEYRYVDAYWQNFRCGVIGYNPSTGGAYNTPNTDVVRRPNGPQIPGDWASNPIQDELGDGCDPDDDNDGLADSSENESSCPYRTIVDSDGDRVVDKYESSSQRCNASSRPECSSSPDGDGDGFVDCYERFGYNSDPYSVDTDGDGCEDWIEIVDVNGDRKANSGDQLLVARRVSGATPADPESDIIYDLTKDGKYNSNDNLVMGGNICTLKAWGGCAACLAEGPP